MIIKKHFLKDGLDYSIIKIGICVSRKKPKCLIFYVNVFHKIRREQLFFMSY